MRLKILAVAALAAAAPAPLLADSLDQHSGWAAWFNTTKLSERWSLVSDVQLRSSDGWEQVRNVIGRAGASYALTPSLSLAAGYARIDTHSPDVPRLTEDRLWQQATLRQTLGPYPLTHRLRLEQRFIERTAGDTLYSDRLRYSLRLQLPFATPEGQPFARGPYAALQNEVFVHLSHRNALNGQWFDQNRAYAGLGYRLNAGLDLEAGYLNQHLNGRTRDTDNHVALFSVYTRF